MWDIWSLIVLILIISLSFTISPYLGWGVIGFITLAIFR